MSLSRKLILMLAALLAASLAAIYLGGQAFIKQWVETNLMGSAEQVRNVLMATRRVYHHQFIESGVPLDENTLGFLPAHALHRISEDLKHWDKSGFSFNNVSDQPRNPFNQADDVEMAAIAHFRAHPEEELRFVPFTNAAGQPYYLYARPIRVEKYCLQCHGDKSQAPPTITKLYDTAYDYAEGDLRGILSIKIPAAPLAAQARTSFAVLVGASLLILGMLGVGVVWAMGRHVIRPLTVLEKHIQEMAAGHLSERIGELPGEFGRVGHAFNQMVEQLEKEHASLLASESKLSTTFELAAVGFVQAAPDGRFLHVNRKLCEMTGYSNSELLAKSFADITHPDDRHKDRQQLGCLMANEIDSFSHEKRYVRKDGRVIWGKVAVALAKQPDGTPDYLIGVIEDISARKAAEEARQQSDQARIEAEHALRSAQTAALEEQREARRAALNLMEDAIAARRNTEQAAEMLRESESRFRALVEQSLAGIYIIQEGYFRYVNPGFAAIFGYHKPEELIDKVQVSDLVSPEDNGRVAENIRKRVDGDITDIQYTFRGLRRDGSHVDVEVHGRIFEYQGKPAVIGLILDVTARTAAEAELRQRNDELERFNRATIGRELDMVELKQQINALARELGRNPPYALGFLDPGPDASGVPREP